MNQPGPGKDYHASAPPYNPYMDMPPAYHTGPPQAAHGYAPPPQAAPPPVHGYMPPPQAAPPPPAAYGYAPPPQAAPPPSQVPGYGPPPQAALPPPTVQAPAPAPQAAPPQPSISLYINQTNNSPPQPQPPQPVPVYAPSAHPGQPMAGAIPTLPTTQAGPTVITAQPTHVIIGTNFTDKPSRCMCSLCRQEVVTRIEYKLGTYAWLIFGLLFFFGIWPCCLIPLFVNSCKDVNHYCPSCNQLLSTYERM